MELIDELKALSLKIKTSTEKFDYLLNNLIHSEMLKCCNLCSQKTFYCCINCNSKCCECYLNKNGNIIGTLKNPALCLECFEKK
jgi:hypothetical protein